MMSPDYRRFLERCYEGGGTLSTWMRGLAPAAGALVARREGVLINAVSVAKPRPVQFHEDLAAWGRADDWLLMWPRLRSALQENREVAERAFRPFLVSSLSRRFGLRSMDELPLFRDSCGSIGVAEMLGIRAHAGTDTVLLTVPLQVGEARSDRDPLLYRVRRHLQSGLMGLSAGTSPRDGDVVADRSGRLLHDGGARIDPAAEQLLKAAALAHDTERRGTIDPDADRVWRELWRGGWALVETVDTDNKRLLLLRKDPSCPHANALSPRELRAIRALGAGLGYKAIALELGIGVSTAGELVASALAKLGLASRAELVRLAGAAHRRR
ncbi:MAG TPA: helix-turn-helix transcriptional regulator [Polyangiaceae bacterium]|jgi:DNA-binding CsgD family transcriptional regulator|nr:helix-turn-helix transcriptional regulator [Polyangiaceae bacterium]